MIIDIHSHTWQYPQHFGDDFRDQATRAWGGHDVDLTVRYEDYRKQSSEEVKTVVFGGKAKLSGMWVDDTYVADYVAQHQEDLIGFLSVDPTQPGWRDELEQGHQDLNMQGIKLLSMYAGFRPCDPELDDLWSYASRHGLPVLLHTGTTFIAQAPLECTLPRHLDDVAIRYPDVKIVMAHLAHPYGGECAVTIRKHPNVYADVSAIHYRPWQLYNALMLVQEYGVWEKLLFGTDYPFATVDNTLEGLRSLNAMLEGTALPRLDEEKMERMIFRDSLRILNL
jgi:predicted TIM-barrel fold metal-dependent hydrolase